MHLECFGGFSQSEVIVERVVGFPYGLLQRIGSPREVDNFSYRCRWYDILGGDMLFLPFSDRLYNHACRLRFTVSRISSDMGVAMKACSNNSLSMFGSFSQQSRITDDIFFCFNARFNALVFIISPRAVLMMRSVFSRALKKSVSAK